MAAAAPVLLGWQAGRGQALGKLPQNSSWLGVRSSWLSISSPVTILGLSQRQFPQFAQKAYLRNTRWSLQWHLLKAHTSLLLRQGHPRLALNALFNRESPWAPIPPAPVSTVAMLRLQACITVPGLQSPRMESRTFGVLGEHSTNSVHPGSTHISLNTWFPTPTQLVELFRKG